MTELARFRPAVAKHQPTFVFERASLALIATWRDRWVFRSIVTDDSGRT